MLVTIRVTYELASVIALTDTRKNIENVLIIYIYILRDSRIDST